MMTVALLPRAWETPRLAIEDSTRDVVPGLQEFCDACRYIEEWSGWKAEEHPEQTMLSVFTEGELPPNGSKQLFRLRDTRQLIGLLEAYHGFPTPDTFWIVYLAIHPRAQGQGYGQELVRALSQVLKRTGTYARIRLIVDLKNWPALRFWVQAGFDRIVNVQGDKVHSAETFACMVVEKSLAQREHRKERRMAQNPFVGTWSLVSCEFRRADGGVTYPYGRDLAGYILYSQDGYMSVALMSANRPRFAAEDIRGGTTEEKVAAADTYISYCGRYEIRGDKVIHHIEVSFFPNWIGADQERFFSLDGDTLSLSTPPLQIGGVQQAAYLVWKRV